jgi:urease gamma subunit
VGLSNEEFTSAITRGKELLSLDKKGRLAQNRAARGVPLTAEERAALQSSMDAMRDLK